MEQSRETEKVILSVQKATLLMDPFFKLGVTGTILLLTYLARMRKEGILNKGEFKNFQQFVRATEGNFLIENLPAPEGFQMEQLQKLGIRGMVMPDLDREDGFMQLAIYGEDKEKFQAWFTRYLMGRMQGGKHQKQDLINLTGGNTSIISIPLEENKEFIRSDFDKLGINYAVLPDLKVGDGEIQIMVANVDMPKAEHWYQLYQERQMSRGNEVKDLQSVSMEQYARTAEMTEEQYVDTAAPELKKRMEKYEGNEPGEIEKSVMAREQTVHPVTDETYERLHTDPSFLEITINHETLVEQSTYADTASLEKYGLFASRVPGTWGEQEKTLVLPADQVFRLDGGKTYLAFLKREETPCILGADGKPLSLENRENGLELYQKYYELADRKIRQPEALEKVQEQVTKQAGKVIAERFPANPVKAR